MINASLALSKSDINFEKNYKIEIGFIESKIWEVVNEGFRSVYIESGEGNWVGESEVQTNRLITYFKEQGFEVRIINSSVGSMNIWKDSYDGIEIGWEIVE